jgi:hypothetical protein
VAPPARVGPIHQAGSSDSPLGPEHPAPRASCCCGLDSDPVGAEGARRIHLGTLARRAGRAVLRLPLPLPRLGRLGSFTRRARFHLSSEGSCAPVRASRRRSARKANVTYLPRSRACLAPINLQRMDFLPVSRLMNRKARPLLFWVPGRPHLRRCSLAGMGARDPCRGRTARARRGARGATEPRGGAVWTGSCVEPLRWLSPGSR